jgi:hypothetical protein
VWHEEWTDAMRQKHVLTTRYDVRPNGVVKVQNGQGYQALSPTELKNFRDAVKIYQKRVSSEIYQVNA